MSKSREDLQRKLEEVCDNVYFQPPRSERMVYPCIKYELAKMQTQHANNKIYKNCKRYTVTYITKDPDDPVIEELLYLLPHTSYDRPYKSENLYHNVYDLYF